MVKLFLVALLPFVVFLNDGSDRSSAPFSIPGPIATQADIARQDGSTGKLEKLIVANGALTLELDLNGLNGTAASSKGSELSTIRFDAEPNSFFTTLVFNGELRGQLPGTMPLIPKDSANLPAKLAASYQQLVLENADWGGQFDLVVRDAATGFIYFNIEGQQFTYDANSLTLGMESARLLLSNEFAKELGRPSDAGTPVGNISMTATMRAIEVSQISNGEVTAEEMPSMRSPEAGTVPGPDVIVGDLSGLAQFGSAVGTQVGLAVGTDSCNYGVENLNWFANPENNHPVIPQNLYRMSGGATNDERFEQIGQSQVKHAFTALTNNICGLGCNGVGGANLGSGCSDPYSASLNAGPSLGSRAWINPFTGFYPRNDGGTTNNAHTGHTGDSNVGHRIRVEMSDLNTSLNAGATYYAESQYVTPHEYVWCQSHPGQCNMNNNVSFRRYNVTGTGSPFSFSPAAATQRTKTALTAWANATVVGIQPDAATDGIGAIGYKVTNPSPGVWHYEYAVYNQNLDRGIQSFSVPVGSAPLSNIGFHAPPQHPGYTFDGTVGNTGYSSVPWTQTQAGGSMTWNSETFAQNANANAIRWGTLYNFRFDTNVPPTTVTATVGFYKTGAPITVEIQGPSGVATPTPTATPTATPTNTPTATPTNTPTATPTATPTPTIGWEGDVAPRPNGDGFMNATDVVEIRRFATGLDTPTGGYNEAQRADSAPLSTGGDGLLNAGDVIQGRRFAAGLDPMVPGGGPTVNPPADGVMSFIDDIYSYFFGREVRVGLPVSPSAKSLTVPIEIVGDGDEAGISFTLEYDASKLSNPKVVLGSVAPDGSVLTVNDNEAGRIGILLDSVSVIPGSKAGQQVFLVTFEVVSGAKGESPISLTNSLAPKGTFDVFGNMLRVRYVDGTIAIPSKETSR